MHTILVKFITICSICFSGFSLSTTLEIWSGLEHELALSLKAKVEAKTHHRIEVRSFDIHALRAELLVADVTDSYYPDAIWVPSDFLSLNPHVNFHTIPKTWYGEHQFEPLALEAVTIENQVKAIPFAIGNHLVLYHRTSNGSEPPTWEALIDLAKQRGKPSISFASDNVYLSTAFYTLFDYSSMNDLNLSGEVVVKISRFIEELERTHTIPANCGIACARNKFINGEVDYLIDGDWAYKELSLALGSTLGIQSLPTYQSKVMTSFSGAKVFAITPKATKSEGKMKLLKAIVDGIMQYNEQRQEGLYISPYQNVNQRLLATGPSDFSTLYRAFTQSTMMPSTIKMNVVWEALGRAQSRYRSGMPDEELAKFYESFVDTHQTRIERGFE
ncbi:extracellular solute-binding protein [Vibrio sp. RE86]|uniref:sugar ABC transporter substrate-binding protein n=1 Tax=Vibrio sp. RE86 TaxID=2607605 RepID=UPI001493D407|nr:extracellular solute-binding protein [Vibrio sp. RE86]NOH81019.1 extracellular solute-binding protein [Vibrio sp. RE86]